MSNFPYRYRFRAKPLNTNIPSQNVILMGDSLTALSYGPLHPYNWTVGLAGGKLKIVANSGIASDTIQNCVDRADNDYLAATPGVSGYPGGIGWVFLRIGTNNFRGGQTISTTTQNQYIALFTKLLSHAEHVCVFAVPPVGVTGDAAGHGIPAVNAWLSSYCSGNSRLHFINDCTSVDDGTGNWVSGYESGEATPVHFTNQASYQLGIVGGPLLDTVISSYGYPSPVSLDAADVYPATQQWAANHRMTGTGGSNTLGSGQVVTSWGVGQGGSGYSATTEIVAADGGDQNTAPWQRVTPTALGNNNSWLGVGPSITHDAITTSYPNALEFVFQLRFNSFDGSRFKGLQFFLISSANEKLAPQAFLRMGDASPISQLVTVRSAINRPSAGRSAAASAGIDMRFESVGVSSGAMGSFDIRCYTVRSY